MRLEVKELCFSYGVRPVLRGVSFSAEPGEIVAVLGPNGVGKSTLFQCLLGFLKPSGGEVLADGRTVADYSRRELAKKIAYIPQNYLPVYDHTVLDCVLMGMTAQVDAFAQPGAPQREKALRLLDTLGISALAERGCTHISGGERQLMLMARALAQDAQTLLLDEPTASLDLGNSVRVMERMETLARQGYTVIFSTHDPNQALAHATKVLALKDGAVLTCGAPEAVLTPETLTALYGVDVAVGKLGAQTVCVPAPRPGREMYCWTQEKVDFMTAASRRSDYHAQLAKWLAPELAGAKSVCDAGCGTGTLSAELAKRFESVTAIDCEALPLAALQAALTERNITNVRVLQEDLSAFVPEQKYDAMVFCQFGGLRDCLRIARRCCRGTVAILKRERREKALPEELEKLGIACFFERRTLELNQPLRGMEEAERYAALYEKEFHPEALRETGNAEYPYELRREKRLCLLVLNAADIPEAL